MAASQNARPAEPRETEPEIIEIDGSSALAAMNRSEIDMMVATAKKYPRSMQKVLTDLRTLATMNEDVAGSMHYALPRDGKTIEGPSVRFAELVTYCMGNIRSGGRVTAIDDRYVTCQGFCFDLERNVAYAVEVKRRITDRNRRRYSDDMIQTTSQAGQSIAIRNAQLRTIPFALVKSVYEEARKASIGATRTLEQRRTAALAVYAKWGATPEQVCQIAGVGGLAELDDDALIRLRGLVNAIRDGEATYDEVLRNATAQPTVVEPERLGGSAVTASDVVAGATRAEEETGEPVGDPSSVGAAAIGETGQAPASSRAPAPAPAAEPVQASLAPVVANEVPIDPASIAARLADIERVRDEKKLKQGIVDVLYRKHLGSMDPKAWPVTTDTWTKLAKVLAELKK